MNNYKVWLCLLIICLGKSYSTVNRYYDSIQKYKPDLFFVLVNNYKIDNFYYGIDSWLMEKTFDYRESSRSPICLDIVWCNRLI